MGRNVTWRPPAGAFRDTLRDIPLVGRERRKELEPGRRIGPEGAYEVVERFSEGGLAHVYRAYHAALDRYVALKVLKPGLPESAEQRFRREARLGAELCHQNLVRVFDVGEDPDDGTVWMAMDYQRGGDLGRLLQWGRTLAPRQALHVTAQVLDALEHVHTRRIVHCDVKPENILLTRDPRDRRIVVVKLIDFGIHRDLTPPLELDRYLSGDPRYMSPEQTVRNGPLDGRSDLYSLGLCLYELLTGRHPFEASFDASLRELIEAQRLAQVPPPSERLGPAVPAPLASTLDDLIARACAKRPEDRFRDAAAMRTAVQHVADVAATPGVAA